MLAKWIDAACGQGAAAANKYIRGPNLWSPEATELDQDQAGQLLNIAASPDILVNMGAKTLANIWRGDPAAAGPTWPTATPRLARPIPREVRTTSAAFKRLTAAGGDFFHPRVFMQLSDEALETIIGRFMICEFLGYMPPAMEFVIIFFLPKPTGGRRPIGLLPSFYRIRCKVRLPPVRGWERR